MEENQMKGVILAAGKGSRLFPSTQSVSKHLLPIYDKPMIYYPLSILLLAKIRDIIIIINQEHSDLYNKILGDGSKFGCKIRYLIQEKPEGIGQSFLIAEKYIKNQKICLVLGDNIFYGDNLISLMANAKNNSGATIFTYEVNDPENYGVLETKKNKILSIIEKPKLPKSNKAITGIYFFDENALYFAKKNKKSLRNEYEITYIIDQYRKINNLNHIELGRGYAWLDTGSFENILYASNFFEIVEKRQGLKIACLEEIALLNKWVSKKKMNSIIKNYPSSGYKEYIKKIIRES